MRKRLNSTLTKGGVLVDEGEKTYAFMILLQCQTEEEVARAMERLNLPLVGLCLDGINITMMKMQD